MDQTRPHEFMRRALALARRGLGRVEPNPMVGAVLVRQGRIVAEGYHHSFGQPHAEVQALRQCARRAVDPAGCELWVTLEPCTHHGQTPPCVDALVRARVGRVVVAMTDPNPVVAGRGVDALRRAGIPVDVGVGQEQARSLNEAYLKRVTTALPWVIAKWAQTVDGRTATRTGDSKWISNPDSRRLTHRLRARVDAVVVGIGTVLADDPRLTARDVLVRRRARVVVVDPNLRLPSTAALLNPDSRVGPLRLTVAVGQPLLSDRPERVRVLESLDVELVGLPPSCDDPSRLALRPLLEHLVSHHGATNILVEGGARLMGAFWQQRLVDQLVVFLGPLLLGDPRGVSAVAGLVPPAETIGQARRLVLNTVRRVGSDVMLDYRVGGDA